MTHRVFVATRIAALGMALAGTAACYPGCDQPFGIGESCEISVATAATGPVLSCAQTLACVPLDPNDTESGNVCLLPLELETTACDTDEDCVRAGFPIDSFCNTEVRTCNCDFPNTWCYAGDVVDVEGCFCTPA